MVGEMLDYNYDIFSTYRFENCMNLRVVACLAPFGDERFCGAAGDGLR